MPLFSDRERTVLTAISKLAFCNPFLPERTEYERAALQRHYVSSGLVWSASVKAPETTSPNVVRVHQLLESLIPQVRARILAGGGSATPEEVAIYQDCAQYLLYQRSYPDLVRATEGSSGDWRFFTRFAADWREMLGLGFIGPQTPPDHTHVFACFRQFQIAFQQIFDNIIGNSMPAARLRASAWQSVFTHDLRRYHRVLYARLHDFPTLITGPSGTAKEIIARAIALSRYVPFDARLMRFPDLEQSETFLPMNLAAMSPTLIESELFGHKRGSFTGAVGDRHGWLETCPPSGSIFLDELGEMELSIQVKLLRVIETRRFSMVGDTAQRVFAGKLIAATNRNLASEIHAGRFREDLYYRLCADQIQTPSLREQIDDSPGVLDDLILFMVRRAVGGDSDEAGRCFPEVRDWIAKNLPVAYAWPGNYRELEQCVRNVIIRRSYQPMASATDQDNDQDSYVRRMLAGSLTMDELAGYYAALVYRQTSSYEETARRLGVDRRTVKAKVESFLERTAAGGGA